MIRSKAYLSLYYNVGSETETGIRKEYIFLKNTLRYLRKDGVLIYIIPKAQLLSNVVRLLSYRFRNIRIFKFPDKEYADYSQIVIFGILKTPAETDKEEEEQLINMGNATLDLTELEVCESPLYLVPESSEVPLFRSGLLENGEVLEGIEKSSLRQRIRSLTTEEEIVRDIRPVTEPHKGHQAMLLAAGYGNGVMGQGDNRHLVHGNVSKVHNEEIEEEEKPDGTVKETRKVVESSTVSIFLRKGTNGEIISLM